MGLNTKSISLENLGIKNATIRYQLSSNELHSKTLEKSQGIESSLGAIAINTGEFTGRSPKDRFIVKDAITAGEVWWSDINLPFDSDKFDALYTKVTTYLSEKEVFVRDSYACADSEYKLNIRVVTEFPWSNMFAYNMFLRPTEEELKSFTPEWTVINAPGFMADPKTDGTRQHNFAILNFTRKIALIGGTGYTGEIKKGIFSALNFILPVYKKTLPMHCSANIGKEGDTAIFLVYQEQGKQRYLQIQIEV
jgi:phosphoenolpyruvate carboxykinase (ATP)